MTSKSRKPKWAKPFDKPYPRCVKQTIPEYEATTLHIDLAAYALFAVGLILAIYAIGVSWS